MNHLLVLLNIIMMKIIQIENYLGMKIKNIFKKMKEKFPHEKLLVESLQKFHHYLGDEFTVECPTGSGRYMNLWEVSQELSRRMTRIFLRGMHQAPQLRRRRHSARDQPLSRDAESTDGGSGVRRLAFRRSRYQGRQRRAISSPGLLRVDGIRRLRLDLRHQGGPRGDETPVRVVPRARRDPRGEGRLLLRGERNLR